MNASASYLRRAVLAFACITAFASVPFLLYELFSRHTLVNFHFVVRWESPWDWFLPRLLIFFFSALVIEAGRKWKWLRLGRNWTDLQHFVFVGVVYTAITTALYIMDAVAVYAMIEPTYGGEL